MATILTLQIEKIAMKQIQKIIDRNNGIDNIDDVIREALSILAVTDLAKSKGYAVVIISPKTAKKLNIAYRL